MARIKSLILSILPARVLLELKKLHYARALRKFSEEDEIDIKIVERIVKPGDHVIDIGANVGWYTKILSGLVGEQGSVYSIEPIPTTFKLLAFVTNRLRLNNVTLLNCGISSSNWTAIMEIPDYGTGGENYYRARVTTEEAATFRLRRYQSDMKSLDSLFADSPKRIAFIKCDVEGHEIHVIMGAAKLIAGYGPAWLVEISGNPDDEQSDAFKLCEILENEGYTTWWFDGCQLKRRSPGDKSINYFFLMDHHLSYLKAQGVSIVE